MLLTPTWLRSHPVILVCAVLLASVRVRPVGAVPAGIEALQARTPTARVIFRSSSEPSVDVGKVSARGCGDSIPSFRCFEADTAGTVKGLYLNVGSFFDRSRPVRPGRPRPQEPRSASTHYFAKYFDPQTQTDTVQVDGLSFNSRGNSVFPAAGVIVTSAASPAFPSPEELHNLQALRVQGLAGTPTCVDLTREHVPLLPGQAAWLVLNFPDAADSVFVGVLADSLPPDHPCDFLTPNEGQVWYRPDPAQRSIFDWAFTVHASSRRRAFAPKAEAWANVKRLYR